MSARIKAGDKLKLGFRRGEVPHGMTLYGVYEVVEYDHNDGPEWPSGSCGQPMVSVVNNFGGLSTMLASRFDRIT